ncbi:MAG TPA: sigma-54 dependent transcriptional regulator [Candidatus Methylomirabilis sp.]|nr:sigma-54 dependent transcriptional regulator [Candidatus Methylomirabilis sp.]
MSAGRILVVEDEVSQAEALRQYLKALPVEVQVCTSAAAACRLLQRQPVHAVLCDLVLPGGGGLAVLQFIRSQGWVTPVIIVTGYGDEASATECLTVGAFDFVSKPVERYDLLAVLRRALLRSGLLCAPAAPRPPADRPPLQVPNLVGRSAAMQAVFWRIGKVAEAETTVCLYGESGTGKELVARAIHYASPRATHPLIVLDCAAIPDGLMESEMFGHVRGAFTSAVTDREGVFQLAEGGTLFLDEVAELPLPLQAKLLRVIQCREFRKVGGKHPVKVNVRLIAATNQDLRARVAAGTFREDLFYRLEVIPITLPPLRERKEDIPLLVEHFLAKFNRQSKRPLRGLSPRTLQTLLRYGWPGNVRELENCLERAAVMAEGELLDVPDLAPLLHPAAPAPPGPPPLAAAALEPQRLKDAERALILQTLQSVQGNRTRAAELLGISLRGLYYKLKEMQQTEALPTSRNGIVNRCEAHV